MLYAVIYLASLSSELSVGPYLNQQWRLLTRKRGNEDAMRLPWRLSVGRLARDLA